MGNSIKRNTSKYKMTLDELESQRKELFAKMILFYKNPDIEIFKRVIKVISLSKYQDPNYEKMVTWTLAVLQKHPSFRSIDASNYPMTMESLLRAFDIGSSSLILRESMVSIRIPQRIRRPIEIDLLWMAFGATGSPKYIELITRVVEDSSQDMSIRQNAEWSLKKYQKHFPELITFLPSSPDLNTNRSTSTISIPRSFPESKFENPPGLSLSI